MTPTLSSPKHAEHSNTSPGHELLAEAGDLPHDPNLLGRIEHAMRAQGLAGDTRPSMICYLAIASRHFGRPLNVSVIGTSAVGKNRKVDYARALHPPGACHFVSASSPKALIYSGRDDEDVFKHRMIVWAEADSIPEDGPGASAIRSLVFDSEMIYEVTEKGEDGRYRANQVRKNGPTGLITTRTRPLSPQHRTRVLEINLEERADEIRRVLKALALEGEPGDGPGLRGFVALQEWLEDFGSKSVTIPFGTVLADLIPAKSATVQRQFVFLLTCVRTIAFLYQLQRKKRPDGAIIATLDDYRAAYLLLLPIFDATASDGVTETIRETVAALRSNETLSLTELAQRLGVAKSTASRRVAAAKAGEWIVDRQTRQGLPAKLSLGEPLPAEARGLPSPEEIQDAHREVVQ